MSRVVVIGGGANSEHEVSLASAAGVGAALEACGHTVTPLTIGRDGVWATDAAITLSEAVEMLQSADVVFPAVHGPRGEDGTLAALLDLIGVPYVGSGVRAGALAMDKWATKLVAGAVGVASARGILVTASCEPTVMLPTVVKPVAAGSSFGVSVVRTQRQLRAAIELALQYDGRVLVEDMLFGREIDIAVLGRADGSRVLSAPLEIAVKGGVFDTESKYDGTAQFRVPASLDYEQLTELQSSARAVYDALGCSGVARVDFFLTSEGWVLNEVNSMPGMTPASQVPRMFAAVGLDYEHLVDALVSDALLCDALVDAPLCEALGAYR